jgi:UDP-N-acetylglucosamine 2-epimerase
MRMVSIIGARPEFVQVAVLSRAIRRRHEEILVHTGQHYDANMSQGFFDELAIPEPEINLGIGSMAASAQCGEMIAKLAVAIEAAAPDLVIVRGDTNSTLAGAIVAKQLLLPLVHIEAGMRSYDRTMPEEINRVVADHLADVCLVVDDATAVRIATEGIRQNVHVVGDVMFDIYLASLPHASGNLPAAAAALTSAPYDLLTIHRGENTDDRTRLAAILQAFAAARHPVLFPIHPRTRARIVEFGIELAPQIVPLEPFSYLQMVEAERAARVIFTDSGGVQREAYFAERPCVTLRDTTEWTNTIDAGWNRLTGADGASIERFLHETPAVPEAHPPLFGYGDAAERIVCALEGPDVARIVQAAAAARAARGIGVKRLDRLRFPAG